ncbi:MAG: tetratricopeptide repeat protein [Polyangiaceae bacterium]|nr:tetratricopeptide repeat protein [Polyangiaceae bacterium]
MRASELASSVAIATVVALALWRGLLGAPVPADRAAEPLARGEALEARGDREGALEASRDAVAAAPDRYFVRLRLATLAWLARDYRVAAEEYRAAAVLAPRAVEPRLGEQRCRLALGDYSAAAALGQAIRERDPHHYLGTLWEAWALMQLGRATDAAGLYRALLVDYPGQLEVVLALGEAELAEGDRRAAADAFREAARMHPGEPRAVSGLAKCR